MAEQDNSRNRSIELCQRVVTTDSFIAEAKKIYGNRYGYGKVEYINREHRVTVVCPVHGDFQIFARDHLDGKGCPKCAKGEKFINKLQNKFGDKFGLEKFCYESSTSPVTLVCPTHGAFSKLPNAILGSRFGCPECANKESEDVRSAAMAKKESEKEAKRKAREDFEAQRLNNWLQEREERKQIRDKVLKAFLSGRRKSVSFYIYHESVEEHIDGIRSGGWKAEYYKPYKLSEEEARMFESFKEGDNFYRFPNEAPKEYFKEAFKRDCWYYPGSLEQYLSHRSCIISFEDNDLVIQEAISYEHHREFYDNIAKRKKKEKDYSNLPKSFVAIDFETLYPQRVSACSVGMVKYKDGEIVDRYYTLIRPPFDYPGKCGKVLTWVHGLTEEMVRDAKTFEELLPEMETFVDGLPLVAHHACVEKACIRDTCAFYGIDTSLDYEGIYDTLDLSRRAEAKLGIYEEGPGTHQLDAVCRRFGISGDNHHHALADAEMSGNLMLVFQKVFEGTEPVEVKESAPAANGVSTPRQKYNPEDMIQRTDLENVSDNPFKNKVVVLTGFAKADSQEYAHQLNELGAIIKDGVNKKTDILIIGYNAGPAKMQKAEELGVRIMPETEYKEIISHLNKS